MRSLLLITTLLATLAAAQGCYTKFASRGAPPEYRPPLEQQPPLEQEPPPVRPGPPEWITPPPGIDVWLVVEPTTFALGDLVTLELIIENARRALYEERFPTGCSVGFEVFRESGEWVAPYRVCNQFGSALRLEPGERRVIEREWTHPDDVFNAFEDLVPGRYWITAGFMRTGMRITPLVAPIPIEIID